MEIQKHITDNFPGNYNYEGLGFQAFGPLVQIWCFLPYSSRQWQHLRITEFIQFTTPPELVLGHLAEKKALFYPGLKI